MANDYTYITNSGTIVPDTSVLLQEVQDEYKAVLGQDLVVTPDTPQGALIVAETTARDTVVRNNAALANQINPNLAGGVFLDAICALTGIQRVRATRSVVTAQLTGIPTTLIPEGSQARTVAGDVFESLSNVTLDGSGNASVDFRSVEFGPIPCNSANLTQIVNGVLGWETVTNADAAVLGQTEQSDADLRQLRADTLAAQGIALPIAITSAVNLLEGVRSLAFLENVEATTQTIEGISLVAHSIYVCVDGGDDTDIATAILNNKSLGANYNGDETVPVTEPVTGQVYNVKFQRPDEIDVLVRVTCSTNGTVIDPVAAVKEAIVAYANGDLDGESGFVVGGDVSSFELAGAINVLYPGIYVSKVEIAENGITPVYSTNPIAISKAQVARTSDNLVTVNVS